MRNNCDNVQLHLCAINRESSPEINIVLIYYATDVLCFRPSVVEHCLRKVKYG